jgi:hypothetical protein
VCINVTTYERRRILTPPPVNAMFLFALTQKACRIWLTTCSCWFLARGFFYPEDGGDAFIRNVGSHKIYTAPHPRRRHSSDVRVYCSFHVYIDAQCSNCRAQITRSVFLVLRCYFSSSTLITSSLAHAQTRYHISYVRDIFTFIVNS